MQSCEPSRTIKSIAPIRADDLGGWTDIERAKQGHVFNIAVSPFAEVQLKVYPRTSQDKKRVIIRLENFGYQYLRDPDQKIYNRHPLVEAVLKVMEIPENLFLEINLFSEAPAGAGTGTSAAITVALIGALAKLTNKHIDVARLAHSIETNELGLECGVQDQICAAHGGVSIITITKYPDFFHENLINSVDEFFIRDLESCLLLFFLGNAHASSEIHQKVLQKLNYGSPVLKNLESCAMKGATAFVNKDLKKLGHVMIENNELQRELHPELISQKANRIIEVAREYGAYGWKVNGAGGNGGSITILTSNDMYAKRQLIKAVEELGRKIRNIPIRIERKGLEVWET